MRAQQSYPLPLRDDNSSEFRALCTRLGISVVTMSGAESETPPTLRPSLHFSPFLLITTDAGLNMSTSCLQPEPAGLGLVFSDGEETQKVWFGFRSLAASSSLLEWLAKLLALYMLRQYRGRVYILCDNASVHVSVRESAPLCQCWIDRFAKVVLQLSVFARACEIWLPAQHDSQDTGLAAGWQQESDELATSGQQNLDVSPLPWFTLSALWDDPPLVLFYSQALVFWRSAFLDSLYERLLANDSLLAADVIALRYDMHSWCRVCESPAVALGHHRLASYLRFISYMPRTFFTVPDCRFCQLPEGNSVAHVHRCSQLYVRMCHTFLHLSEHVCAHLGGTVVCSWDLICIVQVGSTPCGVALCAELHVPALQNYFQASTCAQAMIVTWSGMVWCQRADNVCVIPSALPDSSACLVLELMVREQENSPVTHASLSPKGRRSPYSQISCVSVSVPLLAQQVLAWLLRWDPRLVLHRPAAYHVSIPTQAYLAGGPFSYLVLACEYHMCFLQEPVPGERLVVVCTCLGQVARKWNIFLSGPGWQIAADHTYSIAPLQL